MNDTFHQKPRCGPHAHLRPCPECDKTEATLPDRLKAAPARFLPMREQYEFNVLMREGAERIQALERGSTMMADLIKAQAEKNERLTRERDNMLEAGVSGGKWTQTSEVERLRGVIERAKDVWQDYGSGSAGTALERVRKILFEEQSR